MCSTDLPMGLDHDRHQSTHRNGANHVFRDYKLQVILTVAETGDITIKKENSLQFFF